jgi:hypothetical protein
MEQHTLELIGTIVVTLITALLGPAGVEYVKAKLSKNTEPAVIDPVKKELEQSAIITEELEYIREKFNADRAWITIIHNGGHFLHTNKSIQKFSVMHEVSRLGVSSLGMVFNNLPVSLFSRSIEQQMIGNTIYISDISNPEISTFGLKAALESVGTVSAVSKGIFDMSSDSLIGSIGLDYLHPTNLTKEEINAFNMRSERMSGYISNFIKEI